MVGVGPRRVRPPTCPRRPTPTVRSSNSQGRRSSSGVSSSAPTRVSSSARSEGSKLLSSHSWLCSRHAGPVSPAADHWASVSSSSVRRSRMAGTWPVGGSVQCGMSGTTVVGSGSPQDIGRRAGAGHPRCAPTAPTARLLGVGRRAGSSTRVTGLGLVGEEVEGRCARALVAHRRGGSAGSGPAASASRARRRARLAADRAGGLGPDDPHALGDRALWEPRPPARIRLDRPRRLPTGRGSPGRHP